MNILIAMDSFKGSVSSMEGAKAAAEGFLQVLPEASIHMLPIADGGEGTVETLLSGLSGDPVEVSVKGPLGEPVTASYGYLPTKDTAVFEMAEAAGLPLVPKELRNPLHTTSYGVGEMLLDALDRGYRKFLIGIGGSATNDLGLGMLTALGASFYDADGKKLFGYGEDVAKVTRLDMSGLDPRLSECIIQVACDVNNPLTGPNGASAIYGPQKGATPEIVREMDLAFEKFTVLTAVEGNLPGDGAAGGLGYAFRTFLNAELKSGIALVLDLVDFAEYAKDADLVLTGEGRMDHQSSMGKVPTGVAQAARRLARDAQPVVCAVCGCTAPGAEAVNQAGIDAFFPILQTPCTEKEAMDPTLSKENIRRTAEQILRLYLASQSIH